MLPNTKVSAAKDHGKNYMKVRPPLVRHLWRNRVLLLSVVVVFFLVNLSHCKKNFKYCCDSVAYFCKVTPSIMLS